MEIPSVGGGLWREGQPAPLEAGLGTAWTYSSRKRLATSSITTRSASSRPHPGQVVTGSYVGVAALLVVEVDHEAERSDTANLTPDSMRTHRA